MSKDLPKVTPKIQPAISKIRHRRLPLGASLLIRMHEVGDLSIRDLRYLIGHRRPRLIERPPGFQLVKILELFCRRNTIEHVIEPMHAEWLVEYYEAIKEKNHAKAWSIKFRLHFWIVVTVLGKDAIDLIGKCVNLPFKAKSDD
jgi:hypothetical protein